MQNKYKGDGIEDSPLDMLLVILLEGASKEVVMPSSDLDQWVMYMHVILHILTMSQWLITSNMFIHMW